MTTKRKLHKQGHWVWLESTLCLARDPETRVPKSIICVLRDVTERQRAAWHLERAKMAAENATRMKGDFVANMSHELRTPLTGIMGIHDLLRNDPTLSPQSRRYLELARDEGRSLLTIVNDVLDFSKIEAGQMSIENLPFRLGKIIVACRDFARTEAAKKDLQIVVDVDDAEVVLVGDENRLRQVLRNLLTNAVKFSERGNIVISGGYSVQSGRLRIEVSDNGIGIAEDKLALLFERFRQADASTTRRYGGTGLGLAICKRLLELMGGEIGVASQLGRGSTFWFEAPLRRAPEAAEIPKPRQPALASASLRVLLAEDNPTNQQIIKAMLETEGHLVTVVETGVAAVVAAQTEEFDIILMDVHMPQMDGISATRVIRNSEMAEHRRATPIVGLTANAMARDVDRCREAGMDAHVAKPIEWVELFATLNRLLAAPAGAAATGSAPLPIFDERVLTELVRFVGQHRLADTLSQFLTDMRSRLAALETTPSTADLASTAHSLIGPAGQFGFIRLSRLCAEVENEARQGDGLNRVAELLAEGAAALAAGESSHYSHAAP
jgi:signal transduction histidine kinase/CheY-like chemotaxis protein/HPt (histidine-containing phosphotransfer) domain-containing protein